MKNLFTLLLALSLFACDSSEQAYQYNETDTKAHYSKVAFIGNSITYHNKKSSIGWNSAHGMAATKQENDYVHILSDKMNTNYSIVNIARWEGDKSSFNFDLIPPVLDGSDLVVINIGENMSSANKTKEMIVQDLEELYLFIMLNTTSKVVLVNSFWPNPVVNDAMFIFANKNKIDLVDITGLSISNNMALEYENKAVAKHPNDEGHKAIAEAIYNAIY